MYFSSVGLLGEISCFVSASHFSISMRHYCVLLLDRCVGISLCLWFGVFGGGIIAFFFPLPRTQCTFPILLIQIYSQFDWSNTLHLWFFNTFFVCFFLSLLGREKVSERHEWGWDGGVEGEGDPH